MVNVLLPVSWTTQPDARVVERLVRALREHPVTRSALLTTGPDEPLYLDLTDLAGRPPPRGIPVLNEDIGVLSVPVPAGDAAVVEVAIREVAPRGTRVEPAAEFGIAGGDAPD